MSLTTDNQSLGHSPGPWRMIEKRVVDHTGHELVRVTPCTNACGSPRSTTEVEANARLIASAPELLAAAKALLDVLDHAPIRKVALACGVKLYECSADLIDAIAKAKGKPS
jgi:hypothetical protein